MIPTEDLLDELRRLADGDKAPTTREMNEHGEYSVYPYRERFGSWTAACRAADLTPNRSGNPISTDELLDELHRLADGTTPPTIPDMQEHGAYAVDTYRGRFGSWTAACEAAGLTPRQQGRRIPEADHLAELRDLADGDEPPTAPDMDDHGAYSSVTYQNRFGSWRDACEAAGLTPPRPPDESIPEAALIEELRRLADDDAAPTTTDMRTHGEYAPDTYRNRFGSWAEACRAADLEPPTIQGPIPEEELLAELRRQADGDQAPTTTEFAEDRYSRKPYYNRWGSWAAACRAAGLVPPGGTNDR